MKRKIRSLALKVARTIYDRSNKISRSIERLYSDKKIGEKEESFAQILILFITIIFIVPLLILMEIFKKQA